MAWITKTTDRVHLDGCGEVLFLTTYQPDKDRRAHGNFNHRGIAAVTAICLARFEELPGAIKLKPGESREILEIKLGPPEEEDRMKANKSSLAVISGLERARAAAFESWVTTDELVKDLIVWVQTGKMDNGGNENE